MRPFGRLANTVKMRPLSFSLGHLSPIVELDVNAPAQHPKIAHAGHGLVSGHRFQYSSAVRFPWGPSTHLPSGFHRALGKKGTSFPTFQTFKSQHFWARTFKKCNSLFRFGSNTLEYNSFFCPKILKHKSRKDSETEPLRF